MQEVDAFEVQAQFDETLEKVVAGATVIITREGKPIARFRCRNAEDDTAPDAIAIIEPV